MNVLLAVHFPSRPTSIRLMHSFCEQDRYETCANYGVFGSLPINSGKCFTSGFRTSNPERMKRQPTVEYFLEAFQMIVSVVFLQEWSIALPVLCQGSVPSL